MVESTKITYSELDKIQELEQDIIADISMGDRNIQQKVNEIIKVVNHMIDILNGKLT